MKLYPFQALERLVFIKIYGWFLFGIYSAIKAVINPMKHPIVHFNIKFWLTDGLHDTDEICHTYL